MGARIRLRRVGRKKQASFRIVVTDRAAPRDGAYVEALGFYNPRLQPAELRLDLERVDYWLGNGATPTDTAASLIKKARSSGDEAVAYYSGEERPGKETSPTAVRARKSERTKPKVEEPKAEEPAAAAEPEAPAAEAEDASAATEAAEPEASTAEAATEAAETGAAVTEPAADEAEAPEAEAEAEAPAAEAKPKKGGKKKTAEAEADEAGTEASEEE